MEVIDKNAMNYNKIINTKVFVIDSRGKIYASGLIGGPLRHHDYLLDIANELFPNNQISSHIDYGNISEDKISPFNMSYFFNMMGYSVILNSPSMEGVSNAPKYVCIMENNNPTIDQITSMKYCLYHFDGYCTDFASELTLKVEKINPDMANTWNTITFNGNPNINPYEAYNSYLKEKYKNDTKNPILSINRQNKKK